MAYGRYGTYSNVLREAASYFPDKSGKEQLAAFLMDQWTRWNSQLMGTMVIINRLPDDTVRAGFAEEASYLQQDMSTDKSIINGLVTTPYTDQQLKAQVDSVLSDFDAVMDLGLRVEKVNDGISVLEQEASYYTQEAESRITPQQLEQLKDEAGDAKWYFKQLYNNMLQGLIINEYKKELPDGTVDHLEAKVAEERQSLEENKPSDFKLPKPPGIPKWVWWALGGVGLLAVLYFGSKLTGNIALLTGKK